MTTVASPEPSTIPVLEVGARIVPGYTVLGHLSRGRLLDVYDVWSEERRCRCVVKMLRPDRRGEARGRQRLRAEGAVLLGLSHPHIVRAYELRERPQPVLVLETLTGETLEHMLARRGRLPLSHVVFLGIHLCSALQYLHSAGYLHLDLKPENVIAEAGRAKLIDLSLAQPAGTVRSGLGTPGYRAPEQVRGGPVTAAADVWGAGVVLYEAASGSCAFSEQDEDTSRPQSVRVHRRLPRELGDAIDACLDPDPGGRPTVADLDAVLNRAAERWRRVARATE